MAPLIVTFNYDRSFEQGMLRRLVASFDGATMPQVADVLRTWQIVHVHGLLGHHPNLAIDSNRQPYGQAVDAPALESAIDQIIRQWAFS